MSSSEHPPIRLGPYRVVRTIAQGGMATVYEVHDPDTGRNFAAKVLGESTGSTARFLREYRALARLDHPNLVRVYRYGITETGAAYIVMELLQGVPAQVRVKNIGRPGDAPRSAEAQRIAASVARALDYLHVRGIVHRDIKSSNVLVLGDGQVRLLDFGTARLLDSSEMLTEPGEFVGTFHYASPEQLTGQEVGAASDLYALGVLLYRMLAGRRPFDGDQPHDVARLHLDTMPVPPHEIHAAVPTAVSALVMQLLRKTPEERPASARVVADTLDALLPTALPAGGAPPVVPNVRAIGRQAQIRAIQAVLDHPAPAAALFFAGISGSGRGRLVGLALEEAAQRGFRALFIDFLGVPHPFAHLAERLLPTFAGIDGPSGPAAAARILATTRPAAADVAALLAAAAGGRAPRDAAPLVVGARDLDRGARTAIECLFAAFEQLHLLNANVVVFGAWDEGPFPRTWPGARTVTVPPLTGTEVAMLASHWLRVSSVSPELVRRLLAASGGMPSTLEALVRALPRALPDSPIVVPPSVRDSDLMRLDALSIVQRRAAEAVALAEGELTVAQVAWAIDVPEQGVAEALEALRAARMLVETDGRWHVRVGITADLVRERVRPTRRHLLSRRIADTITGTPSSPRLAEVLLDAGRVDCAAASAVAWAGPLLRAGQHAEVLPLLERVVARRGRAPRDAGLWRLVGECLAEVRPDAPAADHAVARARSLAATPDERLGAELVAARLARARSDTLAERDLLVAALDAAGPGAGRPPVNARLAEVYRLTGDYSDAQRHAEAAGARLGAEPLAWVHAERGELRAGEAAALEAVRLSAGDLCAGLRAAAVLSSVLRLQGRFTEARAQLEPTLVLARSQAPPAIHARVLIACAEVDVGLYRIGQARERASLATEVLAGGVPGALDAPLTLLRARLLTLAGETDDAIALLSGAAERAARRSFRAQAARLAGAHALLTGRREAYADACHTLGELGAFPDLAALAAEAAERDAAARGAADGGDEDPDVTFAPVLTWMEMQPARVTRLEYLIAAARHADRARRPDRADALRARGAALFGQIRGLLSAVDDASMVAHPWRQAVERGGAG